MIPEMQITSMRTPRKPDGSMPDIKCGLCSKKSSVLLKVETFLYLNEKDKEKNNPAINFWVFICKSCLTDFIDGLNNEILDDVREKAKERKLDR